MSTGELIGTIASVFGFSEWLEECTRKGNFPKLGSFREPRYIRATTNGYMTDNETQTARYAIQCEFIYLQKRR